MLLLGKARFRAFSFLFILVEDKRGRNVKTYNMDPDSLRRGEAQQKNSDDMLDAEHVFPAFRVRRPIHAYNEVDGFLLGH